MLNTRIFFELPYSTYVFFILPAYSARKQMTGRTRGYIFKWLLYDEKEY